MTTLPASGELSDPTNTVDTQKDLFEDLRDVVSEMPGGEASEVLTINSGLVTPTVASILVDTEGAAPTDVLDTISVANHPEGRILVVSIVDISRTVTLTHGHGSSGQMFFTAGNDVNLVDPTMTVTMRRQGTAWYEMNRSFGNRVDLARAYYGLGGAAVYDVGTSDGELVELNASNEFNRIHIPTMVGSTAVADGSKGAVPAPTIADRDKFLKGDGGYDFSVRKFESGFVSFSDNPRLWFTPHGFGAVPDFSFMILRCIATDGSWDVGNEVSFTGSVNYTNVDAINPVTNAYKTGPVVYHNTTNVAYIIGVDGVLLFDRITGGYHPVVTSRWQVKLVSIIF